MTLNIIHDFRRLDRWKLLVAELYTQEIKDFRIWKSVAADYAETGIAVAHKQIVLDAQRRRLPFVTIAEDDIRFTGSGAWKYYVDNLPDDFDLYLGGLLFGSRIKKDRTIETFAGTHLWTIHSRFFDTVLAVPERKNIDSALGHKGRFVVCDPLVAKQHVTYSDRDKKVVDQSDYYKRLRFYDAKN